MVGVKLENIVKRYDNGIEVIHGIDLTIGQGEFVVFVGPSGCGKSTLLRMIAGLETITGGVISIGGKVVNDLPPRARDIAMVFQDYALYPHKTVFENLAFGLKLRKFPKPEIDQRVRAAADILKIGHLLDRKPRALSGGQRQRVAMGRAIVRQAQLFLFDEPLSNLDALLRAEMRTEIKKMHQRMRATTIYVTHDQVEAMTLAERIVILDAGRVQQIGTPDQVYNHPASRFVAGFIGSPPMRFLKAVLHVDNAGRADIAIGDTHLPVPYCAATAGLLTSAMHGRPVDFGIRPEDISVAAPYLPGQTPMPPPDSTRNARLPARVVVIEPLGADTMVFLQCDGGELIARLSPGVKLSADQTIEISIDMDRFHLFDAHSGAVIPVRPVHGTSSYRMEPKWESRESSVFSPA